ncbi:MAG: PepSY domain-containing protein [Pseudomonadota bacterium]
MRVNPKRLFRQIHYWLSLAILLPAGVMFMAGTLLMLKKEVAWIQPPTSKGVVTEQIPEISYQQMVEAARAYPETQISEWSDIDRIDVRPDKGIAKVRAKSGWEIQIDTRTSDVLNVAYRRSDLIESIHDGSFFAGWVKLYLFLPAGVLLVIMWGTGIYLFVLPKPWKRAKVKPKRSQV